MDVKTIELTDDILTFYVEAKNFSDGIPDTFIEMEKIINGFDDRNVYGISMCEGDKMIYRACVKEKFVREGPKYQLPGYVIPKGTYLYTTLKNWKDPLPQITKTYDVLLKRPDVKKPPICLEDYRTPDEMLIMIQHKYI